MAQATTAGAGRQRARQDSDDGERSASGAEAGSEASGLVEDFVRMTRRIGPERGKYTVGLAALLMVNVSDVLAPVFMAVAVDLAEAALTGAPPKTPQLLTFVGLDSADFTIVSASLLYLALQASANFFRYPMLMLVAVPSHQIGQRLRNQFVAQMMRLSQPFYDRSKSGDLMSLATADIQAARMFYGPGVLVGADVLMIVSLVLLVLFGLSWKLTLIAMLPLPLIAVFTNKLSHMEYGAFKEVQEDLSTLTERARESYSGIQIIQGYAREAFDRDRFEQYSWRHLIKNLRLARVRAVFDPTLDLMLGASTVLVLVFGGLEVLSGAMTLGTFVAFLFLVRYLSGPMIGFGWAVSLFQRGRASMKRLEGFLDEPVEIKDAPEAQAPERLEGALELRDLTFRYINTRAPSEDGDDTAHAQAPEVPARENALAGLSLEVPAGTTLGILGPVGSGKTTLVRLLVRLYDPPPGTVFIDGQDVRELALSALRRDVVLAPQDTFLFSDSVARNMSIARPNQGGESPDELARLAHLHEEIDALPKGYDTLLGERGVNLSGGQRQRLAIARAIGADPSVLILDDCLSAGDARTEEAILDNLDAVFAGRTGVIVSHRVIAVRRCDQIIVLEDGAITERGTHDALMAQEGYYARIAREQTQGDAAASTAHTDSEDPR